MIQVAKVSRSCGWDATLRISERCREELLFWQRNMGELNGFPIRSSPTIAVLDPILSSDTSNFQSGGGLVGDHSKRFQVHLQAWEMDLSSCYRELLGIETECNEYCFKTE